MDHLINLAGTFLERTVYAIGRQLGSLIFYHSNIGQLKEKLEDLQNEQSAVQHSIDAATRNVEKIEEKVQAWMNKVEKITRRAQQFYEEESQANTGCSRTSCPNLWSRHQLSRRAKKMALEVDEIRQKGNFNEVSYRDSPQWIPESTFNNTNEEFESRMSIMNEIMEALKDPSINMIGLCGLGGVGKTTIAREVAKKVKDDKAFDKVIMATISDNPDLGKIQGEIAEMLGLKLDETIESIRSCRLKKRLKQEKNLLLILDDLWKELDLDKIGFTFVDDGKNNNNNERRKILLTSRNEKLLSEEMKCKRNIKVDVLSEKEAWELFKGIAELHDDWNFLSIAKEIVQKCAGLPVRIVAAAKALRNKTPSEWKDALQRLKNPLQRNITRIEEADSIFLLSYYHLNQELQHIFLLCAMLSYDPLIINLLMYSVGLGLLQGIQNMEQVQDRLEALVCKLKALSLLLESDSNDRLTMHDVVRDFAVSITSYEQHALVVRHERQFEWPNKNLLEGYTGIYLDKVDFNDPLGELYGPKLEFFLLHNEDPDLHMPSTFFKSMHELQVLGLTDVHFSSLPSLLTLLEKLRTLCLHFYVLEDIAEVGKLKNLKILSLSHSIIKRLPGELGQLTCLRMLNLANCSKLEVIPLDVLSSLRKLEILCMENSFKQWEGEGSSKGNENASLVELRHLRCLSCLDIHIPNASVLPKDLFSETCLERYKIFMGEDWEWSGNLKPQRL